MNKKKTYSVDTDNRTVLVVAEKMVIRPTYIMFGNVVEGEDGCEDDVVAYFPLSSLKSIISVEEDK